MTSLESIRRIALEAKEHPERGKLGSLAYDALARQAEGKALFAARDAVEAKAEQLGVTRELAESESGNLLVVLGRGATSDVERRLVAAFAVLGFRHQATTAKDVESVVARFVRAADWLELATPYVLYAFVDLLLDEGTVARVHRAIADSILAETDVTNDARARNVVRVLALASSSHTSAREERARLAPRLGDPVALAVLSSLRPDEGLEHAQGRSIAGSIESTPRSGPLGVLRVVSGFATVSWIVRFVLATLGVRRTAELSVVPGGVRVLRRTTLLGRIVHERSETFARRALESLARELRYPMLRTLVGVGALALGTIAGAFLVGDGVGSASSKVLVLGAVLCVVGVLLDLALDVLPHGARGRVAIEIRAAGRRAVRIGGVEAQRGEAFLEALARPTADIED